ncbi:GNAT family N-acetyltransferase [Paenibacillus elgii]|uniref:GNAT family N-acetyltransferase n=1 Tax=Paenibacillus elgii TaxID=189691 RepID=UPI000248C58B|nr:GNAT family N-acetyltransferase [Paenibacillus elgii]
MNGITIRNIGVTDYRDIYLLNQDFNPSFYVFSEDKVKERIEFITNHTKDIILVSELNNEVIGYIHGSPYYLLFSDPLLNILGFVVKEKYRSQGVGGMLIHSLEDWAETNGFSGIKLLSHPSRIHAHRFYERRGYVFTKDQKNYIKKFN